MKKIATLTLLILISTCLFAQNKVDKKAQRELLKAQIAEQVDSLVNAKQLAFLARYATPAGEDDISLGAVYDMRIMGDSVQADLPYFGRTYMVDYGNIEGGIRLKAPIQDYKVTFKKGNYNITFNARGSSDTYRMNFTVSQSGFCTLSVSCNNRQTIGFNGVLDQLGL